MKPSNLEMSVCAKCWGYTGEKEREDLLVNDHRRRWQDIQLHLGYKYNKYKQNKGHLSLTLLSKSVLQLPLEALDQESCTDN